MVLPPQELGKSHDSRGKCPITGRGLTQNLPQLATVVRTVRWRVSLEDQPHDSGPSNRASLSSGERDGSGSTLANEQCRQFRRQRYPRARPGERREPAAQADQAHRGERAPLCRGARRVARAARPGLVQRKRQRSPRHAGRDRDTGAAAPPAERSRAPPGATAAKKGGRTASNAGQGPGGGPRRIRRSRLGRARLVCIAVGLPCRGRGTSSNPSPPLPRCRRASRATPRGPLRLRLRARMPTSTAA